MIETQEYTVCASLVNEGLLEELDAASVEQFLVGDELRVLFFSGPHAVRREAHDVAVALREVLKDYEGSVIGGHVGEQAAADLQARFRVTATPCIVFALAGEVIEVMPRVRDWADYAAAFARYLGPAHSHQRASGAQS